MRRTVPRGWIAIFFLSSGCATGAGGPSQGPTTAGAAEAAPNASAVHWVRDAAERVALLVQTYRWAGEHLAASAAGRASGSWGVILDADETVLDNSTYQKERLPFGGVYTSATWNAWVVREEATAVPGARDFIALARRLGGRVAIVTNRDDAVCPETRSNLERLGVVVDVVLCREATSDKNPRFERVRTGNAAPGLPPVDVLMWVGDNIQDFPSLSQDVRSGGTEAYAGFGSRFVVLPNPMYGSWQANPPS